MIGINTVYLKNEYKKTVDAITLGLLFHTALAQLTPTAKKLISNYFPKLGIGESTALFSYLNSAVGIILYSVIFLLPAFFIFRYTPKPEIGINFKRRFPKNYFLLLVVTIGSVTVVGNLTTVIQNVLYKAGIGFIKYAPAVPDDILGIILLFVSSAVTPAIVEEILFRKVILERLAPYGKDFAVILTSVLFALMHTNFLQFFYAFAGGLFMGYATLKCKSVIPAMIIHFSNNSLSLVYLLLSKLVGGRALNITLTVFDTALGAFGLIALYYMYKKGGFDSDRNTEAPVISPKKDSFNIFLLSYVIYTLYLSARWIYFI